MKKSILKKSLALCLAVLLMAATFVPSALADEGYPMDIHPDMAYTSTDHLTAGGTVYLSMDEFPKDDIVITKNTVINLNGHTLAGHYYDHKEDARSTDRYIVLLSITNGASVTITNGTMKDIRVTNENGNLTLKNVKFEIGGFAQTVQNSGTMSVDGCSFTASQDNRFIWNNGTINYIRNCTVTIPDDCSYNGDIVCNVGTIRSVEGCTFTGPYGYFIENDGENSSIDQIKNCRFTATATGSNLSAYAAISNYKGKMGSISNTTIVSASMINLANAGSVNSVSGCTFDNTGTSLPTVYNIGTLQTLSNTTLKTGGCRTLDNTGTIDTISGCTMASLSGYSNVLNTKSGKINNISGCNLTVVSGGFLTNEGTIGTISACTMKGQKMDCYLQSAGTIDLITDCDVTSESGNALIVVYDGEIKTIQNTMMVAPSTAGTMIKKGKIGTDHSGATNKTFGDVPRDAYYMPAVYWAKTVGVTTGRSADVFDPKATCTRGEVATFLWRAMGKPEPKAKENPFTDVSEEDYYYKAVLWAVENGITNGTSADTFSPNQTCTNAHIITFLWRTMKSPGKTDNSLWYGDAENWAKGQSLLTQTAAANNISGNCPRCDVVTFLHRVLKK